MPTVKDIPALYQELTPKQRDIANFMLANPDDICYITLNQLAKRANTTEVSVIRLYRKLGFDSFLDLKQAFRDHTQRLVRGNDPPAVVNPSVVNHFLPTAQQQLVREMISYEQDNINALHESISAEQLFSCARQLLDADQVMLLGHSSSKVLADYFTLRLNYLRVYATSIKLDDSFMVHSTLARLKRGDVVVLFSFRPYYLPIYNVSRFAEYHGISVITITDSLQSPAYTEVGNNFICQTSTRFFFNSQTATVSLINLLASCMAVELGETLDKIQMEENAVSHFLNAGMLP